MVKAENAATRIAVLRGEIAEGRVSLARLKKEMERIQQEAARIENGLPFLEDRLRIIEASAGAEGVAISSEFAGRSLVECIRAVIETNRMPMRLVEITKELQRRGFQAKSRSGFTTTVLRTLKKTSHFIQRDKLWSLDEAAVNAKEESNAH